MVELQFAIARVDLHWSIGQIEKSNNEIYLTFTEQKWFFHVSSVLHDLIRTDLRIVIVYDLDQLLTEVYQDYYS